MRYDKPLLIAMSMKLRCPMKLHGVEAPGELRDFICSQIERAVPDIYAFDGSAPRATDVAIARAQSSKCSCIIDL